MNCTKISNNDIISITIGIYSSLLSLFGIIKLSYFSMLCINYNINKIYYKSYDKKWFDMKKYESIFENILSTKIDKFYVCIFHNSYNPYPLRTKNDSSHNLANNNKYIFNELNEFSFNFKDNNNNNKQDIINKLNSINELNGSNLEELTNLNIKYNNNHYIHIIFKYKIEKLYNKILNNNNKLHVEIYEECIMITNNIP